jgi:hypothetical protein
VDSWDEDWQEIEKAELPSGNLAQSQ